MAWKDCGPASAPRDLNFSLLLTVADWFRANAADGLTPRQVPVPGVQAKWLNTRRPVVELLTGRPLNLAPRHPARIHLTYLDPEHLAAGSRRFDSATVGDMMRPAYPPEVIITENKDTAIHFLPQPAGSRSKEEEQAGPPQLASTGS